MWLLSALFACSNGPAPTFYDDVAPILDEHCMGCHTDGGIAPMKFDTYETTVEWADAIVMSTQDRSMPPKQVVQDGSCGDFKDPWWLSDDELQTLADWAARGTREGKPTERTPHSSVVKIEPTHYANLPEIVPEPDPYISPVDEYRCLPVQLENMDSDMYLTAFDVKPGNAGVVHHVISHMVDPDADSYRDGMTNREVMDELDAQDERPGWPCDNGNAGSGITYAIGSDGAVWAPGQGATKFPEGTGFPVPQGTVLVAQIHYNMADPEVADIPDATTIELVLEEDAKRIYGLYLDPLLAGEGWDAADPNRVARNTIPAGESAYQYTFEFTPEELGLNLDFDVIGVMPHMHGFGVELDMDITRPPNLSNPEPVEECLVDVPNWDYAWQFNYFYEQPVRIHSEDRIRLTCTFNTEGLTQPVLGGWGTQDEMCLAVAYLTLPN